MSLTIDRPRHTTADTALAGAASPTHAGPALPAAQHPRTAAPVRTPAAGTALPARAARPAPAAEDVPTSPVVAPARSRALPEGTEARGFALYVGIDEAKAAAAGTSLAAIVEQLKALTAQLAPAAETYAAVAVAAEGSGGRDVEVVRLALQDRSAVAARKQTSPAEPEETGVVIDISRKRVVLDGETAPLTYKEFELLQFLVLREGRTVDRQAIIEGLWADGEDETPNERTIDVHVRRLRSKLGAFEEIVRTVRGVGYRFDRHADVAVRYASTPSPDLF
ncbi:winged helix-turn-helix domain-containing protein [Curtobacterium sp. MCBD17_003]|uniref:winged helix-turn-helix domain-containing protein n=1 Tax=Curtobacterium sp. MCBD17_003 TaxID=2175667 RepID=UPI000DAA80E3|nr:winged helix-turn-helix domain-containing protein [Curtobacterium sp. MCBD17_003]WIE53715.1 winged helix-turn-helix domain-containing protein [Curtobacterium sp. MCBD17_003]